jgi:dihydrofolate reductase
LNATSTKYEKRSFIVHSSIPKHLRQLKNRLNAVLTKSPKEFLENDNLNEATNL